MMKNILLILFFSTLSFILKGQSFFAEGEWIKIGVTEEGFCKLTKSQLNSFGLTVTDKSKIKVYGGDARILEQENAKTRYFEPQQVPHLIVDTGKLATDFALVFLTESAKTVRFDASGVLNTQLNDFTDTVFYYITQTKDVSKQVTIQNSVANLPVSDKVILYGHYEKDEINFFTSGRRWVSDKFVSNDTIKVFDFDVKSAQTDVLVNYNVASWSSKASTYFDFKVGDSLLQNARISRSNSGYGVKLRSVTGTFSVSKDLISDNLLKLKLDYDYAGDVSASGYVDYFDWQYESKFSDLDLGKNAFLLSQSNFTFARKSVEYEGIWYTSINNPFDQALVIPFQKNDSSFYDFNRDSIKIRRLDLNGKFVTVQSYLNLKNFDLSIKHANPKLLIIYHPKFINEVIDYQKYKESKGVTTEIANINQVLDVYGSGKKDISAVRNYIRQVYTKSTDLKYVLLFGDCSYDYKDRITDNTNFIPVYQSQESFHNVQTYSSDDFYGFMEPNEGVWEENSNGNHTLDIAIGRFPISTVLEAQIVIEKVKQFDKFVSNDSWKSKVLFVADDKDDALHVDQASVLMELVKNKGSYMRVENVFLDAYSRPDGSIETAKNDFLNKINDGAMFVNFTGHGTDYIWMEEQILTIQDIKNLKNVGKNSVFITATCEFGRYDNPRIHSGAEELIFAKNGAISMITTTRPVYSSSNFEINKSFYNSLFESDNIKNKSLGEIFQITKNNSLNGVFNRNFSLLGDPSMLLSFPNQTIRIDSINNIHSSVFSDTIHPLESINIKGSILKLDGSIDKDFDGVLELLLFDNSELKNTKGYGGQLTYPYQSDPLLITKVYVNIYGGEFDFDFSLPNSISVTYGSSQLQLHATDNKSQRQALGSFNKLIIGGDYEDINNLDPEIIIEIPSEELEGVFSTSLNLIVNFKDDYGILLNKENIGKETKMIVNGDLNNPVLLNDSLIMKDNSSKWLITKVHLENLNRGLNTIEFQTWDIHGQGARKSIDINTGFAVSAYIYPNPLNQSSKIHVKNTLIEENYELVFHMFNQLGEEIFQENQTVKTNEIEHEIEFEGLDLNILQSGLYYYTLDVRFISNKHSYKTEGKLIKI